MGEIGLNFVMATGGQASLTKAGEKLKSPQKRTKQVALNVLKQDARANITAFSKSGRRVKKNPDQYMEIKVGGKPMMVRISSLVKRLHLGSKWASDEGRAKIKQMGESGLLAMLEKRKDKLQALPKRLDTYEAQFDHWEKTGLQFGGGLEKSTLLKMVRKALPTLKEGAVVQGKVADLPFRARPLEGGAVEVSLFDRVLGKGGLGEVQAWKVVGGSAQAVKSASSEATLKELKMEVAAFKALEDLGLEGCAFQEPLRLVEVIGAENQWVAVGPVYDGSMEKLEDMVFEHNGKKGNYWEVFTPREQLGHLMPLFETMARLQEVGGSLSDIKAENILFRKTPEGQVEFHLADIGSLRVISEERSRDPKSGQLQEGRPFSFEDGGVALTTQVMPFNDLKSALAPEGSISEYSEKEHKRDVFAFAYTAMQLLARSTQTYFFPTITKMVAGQKATCIKGSAKASIGLGDPQKLASNLEGLMNSHTRSSIYGSNSPVPKEQRNAQDELLEEVTDLLTAMLVFNTEKQPDDPDAPVRIDAQTAFEHFCQIIANFDTANSRVEAPILEEEAAVEQPPTGPSPAEEFAEIVQAESGDVQEKWSKFEEAEQALNQATDAQDFDAIWDAEAKVDSRKEDPDIARLLEQRRW